MKNLIPIALALMLSACTNWSIPGRANNAEFRRVTIGAPDTAELYLGEKDSGRLFYYEMAPASAAKGMLVIFPPNGQPVEETAAMNTALAKQARDSGLVTIVPAINHNLYLDEAARSGINMMLGNAKATYHLPDDKIVFGGFSLGGMNAIRYAELAAENPSATSVHPIAVYGIDPPLDWIRAYSTFEKSISGHVSAAAVSEANYFLERLIREFGGTPATKPDVYMRHSMFSANDATGGNARFLKNIPVRIYSDPDTAWYRINRGMAYKDINAADGAAFIGFLQKAGNRRAEFVSALGKGRRPDGTRHPHSWSLAEPTECLEWIMRCIRGNN